MSGRILVTGSGGFIGRLICDDLDRRGYRLRGFDRTPPGRLQEEHRGDLTQIESLRVAMRDCDTLIHLAACADEAPFLKELLPANVIGLYNLLEAACETGLQRLILAGSCQAADLVGRKRPITVEDRFPTDHYGLTKLWLEDMVRLYVHKYQISALVLRLGWVLRSAAEWRLMQELPGGRELYLGHGDVYRLFEAALQSPFKGFHVVHAFSKQEPTEHFDMQPTRALLGFEPRDAYPQGLAYEDHPKP